MILGYEQPVDIPVMSIYDKDMMKMYLNALHEDYKEGVAAQKEFNDKYGNFVSPIQGASEAYYNAGQGKVQAGIQKWEQDHGTPAIRSVEGRAYLQKLVNDINVPLLNTIKQSAKNREQYDDAKRKLIMTGKYNEDLENMQLNKLGIDPNNWNNNQLWTRLSPDPYMSVQDSWGDTLKAIPKTTKQFVDKKNGLTYNREGVFEENVRPIVDANFDNFANTPSGQLFMDNIKKNIKSQNSTISEADLNKKVQEIAKSAIIKMGVQETSPEVDRGALAIYNNKFEAQQKALDRANPRTSASIRRSNTTTQDIFEDVRNYNDSTYDPKNTIAHNIKPVDTGVQYDAAKNYYTISDNAQRHSILALNSFTSNRNSKRIIPRKVNKYSRYVVKPNGRMIKGAGNKYGITGTLYEVTNNGSSKQLTKNPIVIEVTKNTSNYGRKIK